MFKLRKKSGFTLLEMIVSLAVFMLVAVVAVGSMVRIVGLNRQAQAMQSAMNNISFALESISRELRVGSKFQCSPSAQSPYNTTTWGYNWGTPLQPSVCDQSNGNAGQVLAFVSQKTAPTGVLGQVCHLVFAYRFNKVGVYYRLEKAAQRACNDNLNNLSFVSILDDTDVFLTDYELMVSNRSPKYEIAFIRLVGKAGIREKDTSYFDVQTAVAQRIHD